MHVPPFNTYLAPRPPEFVARLREIRARFGLPREFHVVRRVGVDHVGIGTDFDHGAGIVGFKDASEARNVTRGLLLRGHTAADVTKIWSGNFLRVKRAAEAAAVR